MLYGPEKVREIARSLLPSTRRRHARESAARLKRTTRRYARQSLRAWARYENPYDYEGHIYDYDEPSPHHAYGGTIKDVMWERRNGDKLGAFLRWADAHTAHLESPEDKYNAVKKAMPDNLIGRHALTHLGPAYDTGNPYEYRWRASPREPDPWRDPGHIEHVVREILAAGLHKDLNRRLVTPFAGLHDLDRFVEKVQTYQSNERGALIVTWDELNTPSEP
jgi:hypothetical protein